MLYQSLSNTDWTEKQSWIIIYCTKLGVMERKNHLYFPVACPVGRRTKDYYTLSRLLFSRRSTRAVIRFSFIFPSLASKSVSPGDVDVSFCGIVIFFCSVLPFDKAELVDIYVCMNVCSVAGLNNFFFRLLFWQRSKFNSGNKTKLDVRQVNFVVTKFIGLPMPRYWWTERGGGGRTTPGNGAEWSTLENCRSSRVELMTNIRKFIERDHPGGCSRWCDVEKELECCVAIEDSGWTLNW